MKVVINNQEELIKYARDLTHIVTNLRHAQKEWQEYYGAELLNKKKGWEKRMDDFINEHNIETSQTEIHVKTEADKPVEEKQNRKLRWRQKSNSFHEFIVDKYELQVIKMDEVNYYWDVYYDGVKIANCDKDKTTTTIKQAKDAARWRMEKHKDSLTKKIANQ